MQSKEYLEQYFYYDETSESCLRWKVDRRAGMYSSVIVTHKGQRAGAWTKASNVDHTNAGSWNVSLNKERLKVHRVIYQIFYGDLDCGYDIDHINGDARDNRISNLRKVTHSVNMRNGKKRINNSTGVTGVEFYSRKGRSDYFVASWRDKDGKSRSRSFSVSIHGKEGAFVKAIEARFKGVEEAGDYTESHGFRK